MRIVELLESGISVTKTLRLVSVKRRQFYDWLKDDAVFRERIMHSDLADIVTIDDVTFVKALSGSTADRRLFYERREGITGGEPDDEDDDIANLQRRLGLKK